MTAMLLRDTLRLQSVSGTAFAVHASDYVGWRIAYGGGYEPLSLALARSIMREGGTFVDAGCNVGLYTLSVGELANVNVVAVDASFTALHRLAENVSKNPHITRVRIVHAALGASPDVHPFELPVQTNLGTTRVANDAQDEGRPQFWSAGTTLQLLLDRLGISSVRLLKLDVEGVELEVLRGLDFSSSQRPQNIIMECEPTFPRAHAALAFLSEKGYDIRTVTGAAIGNDQDIPEQNVWCRLVSQG